MTLMACYGCVFYTHTIVKLMNGSALTICRAEISNPASVIELRIFPVSAVNTRKHMLKQTMFSQDNTVYLQKNANKN